MTTYPPGPINERQKTDTAKKFLRAQAHLYTVAKRMQQYRQAGVIVIAVASVIAGIALPDARVGVGAVGTIGGVAWFIVTSAIQKRNRSTAVAVQEEFDTLVYQLTWKSSLVDHPTPTEIAEAARRYNANRIDDNWYPNTGPVARPLDILICQRSNLGWGANSHRDYANWLTGLIAAIAAAAAVIGIIIQGSWTSWLLLVLPLLAPLADAVEQRQAHLTSSEDKKRADTKLTGYWDIGMGDHTAVTSDHCRDIQDLIVNIRRTNANVPDWFDNRRRNRYETGMAEAANQLIEQAVANGKTTGTQP